MKIDLDYLKLNIVLQLEDGTMLPRFPAITFRGGLGSVLKKLLCLNSSMECFNCPHMESCTYTYIFKTAIINQKEVRNNSKLAPPPYLIIAPYGKERQKYKKREIIELELKLIGEATSYLPYFIYAFEELGTKGLGKDRVLYDVLYVSNQGKIIYKEGKLKEEAIENNTYSMKEKSKEEINNIKLVFDMPVRIEKGGDLVRNEFSFELIMRNILRRLDAVTYFHMGYKLELDYHEWITKAKKIKMTKEQMTFYDNIRYSSNQNRKIWMGGFTGKLEFAGSITPFLPFLELGSIIHIGKKCAFGMGGYQLQHG